MTESEIAAALALADEVAGGFASADAHRFAAFVRSLAAEVERLRALSMVIYRESETGRMEVERDVAVARAERAETERGAARDKLAEMAYAVRHVSRLDSAAGVRGKLEKIADVAEGAPGRTLILEEVLSLREKLRAVEKERDEERDEALNDAMEKLRPFENTDGGLGELIGRIAFNEPVWPCPEASQDVAMLAHIIHGQRELIAKLKENAYGQGCVAGKRVAAKTVEDLRAEIARWRGVPYQCSHGISAEDGTCAACGAPRELR